MNNPYLPAGTASTAVINHILHDNVAGEITAIAEKEVQLAVAQQCELGDGDFDLVHL